MPRKPTFERRLYDRDGHAICARCRDRTNTTIMSMFSVDIICMDCEDIERAHPRYAEAVLRERAASAAGEKYFPGIGAPRSLIAACKAAQAARVAAAAVAKTP